VDCEEIEHVATNDERRVIRAVTGACEAFVELLHRRRSLPADTKRTVSPPSGSICVIEFSTDFQRPAGTPVN
jgi:hypothetical protein